MTSNNPDDIRDDIERTRRELGSDVDALADKVTPSKVIHRQTDKVKDAVGSVRDRVFGIASDAKHSVLDAAHDVTDGTSDLPHKAKSTAEGNPLAVGLIAFGVGWLVSSLIPASSKEQEAAEMIKEKAEPLVGEAKDAARQVAEDLKEPAKDAATAVKDSATEAADAVKSEGQDAASELKDQGASAADTVRSQGGSSQ